MDTYTIKDPNPNLENDFSLNTSANCYLHSNGLSSHDDHHDDDEKNHFDSISDVDVISAKSVCYTSLKDLLPASPTAGITSPTTNNSSWNEIPIKNPLVKQAALAYLQPMSSPPELGDNGQGFFGKLKDACCFCCQCGCFGWINDVVFASVSDDGEDADFRKVD